MSSRSSMTACACALASTLLAPMTLGAMDHMAGMTMPADKAQSSAHNKIPWVQARQILLLSRHEGRSRGRTVTFRGKTVAIAVVANAPHHPDMSFEIGGLTNPTITVTQGSSVTLTFLNMDYGPYMDHGVVITATRPPYPAHVDRHLAGVLAHIRLLPPRSRQRLARAHYAEGSVHFLAQKAGTYYYVCPIPGHALAYRMYGRFLVRNAS